MIMVLDQDTTETNIEAASCLFAASHKINEAAEIDAATQQSLDAAMEAASLEQLETESLQPKAAIPSTDDAASCLQNIKSAVSGMDTAMKIKKTIDMTSPMDAFLLCQCPFDR